MKKIWFSLLCSLGLLAISTNTMAENLLQVFQQAILSDPVFQGQIAQFQATEEGVPIARSYLFPQLSANGYGQRTYETNHQGIVIPQLNTVFGVGTFQYNTSYYQVALTQSVFDFALWAGLKQAKFLSKAAEANLNAALQSLMFRTTQAYFNVLSAQDNLRYIEAEKKAIYQQLDLARQQYKVGVIPITNVYQAEAQYDTILSQEIAAQNNVINARESLRKITGQYYNNLWALKNKVPLINPQPADPKKWVGKAMMQNWSLISQRLNASAAEENISVQRAGNFPTVSAYAENMGTLQGNGPEGQINLNQNVVGLQLNLPVFEGGLIVSQTKQATYQYQNALANVETTLRTVINDTYVSYNDVVASISQIKADMQAVLSNASSLHSTIEGYKVGVQTMLDVLQSQQNLYNAEKQYSTDQYNYLNATVALKEAAGTLSVDDLRILNSWLTVQNEAYSSLSIESIQQQAIKQYNATVKTNAQLGITAEEANVIKEMNSAVTNSTTMVNQLNGVGRGN